VLNFTVAHPGSSTVYSVVLQLLLAVIDGSNPAGCMDVCLLGMLCVQVEVSATGRSLVQGGRTECVCVCVSLNVIRCTNSPTSKQVGRRDHTERERKKE